MIKSTNVVDIHIKQRKISTVVFYFCNLQHLMKHHRRRRHNNNNNNK